jgi:hypothetical protein
MTGTSRHNSANSRRTWSLAALLALGLLGVLRFVAGEIKARKAASSASGTSESETNPVGAGTATEQSTADEPDEPAGQQMTAAGSLTDGGETADGQAQNGEAGQGAPEKSSSGFRVQTDRLTVDDELGTGPLDGAWWPSSATAADVVTELVSALPDDLGRVIRISLCMTDWSEDQPKSVPVEDGQVHLAWFTGMQRHTARITFEDDEAITVLVIPPDTEQETAASLLKSAAEDRSRSELLAEAGIED